MRAAFEPLWLECDVYDHAPFFRRMGGEKTIAHKGGRPEAAENTADSRTRFTVVVPGATDKTALTPTILFKSKAPELTRDFETVRIRAGSRVFAQYGAKPTYNESLTLRLFENQYSQPHAKEFLSGAPRLLIFDQFQGQLTEKCIRSAIKFRKIPLVIFGGLTGILQPADLYQIKQLKTKYRAREQLRLMQIQCHRPDAVPQVQREDIVHAVAQSWSELTNDPAYPGHMQKTFARCGITARLGGAADEEISQGLKLILEDTRGSEWGGEPCSFFTWRERYVASLKPPPRSRGLAELFASLENPYQRADREKFFREYLNAHEALEAEGDEDLVQRPSAEGSASDEHPLQSSQADHDHVLGITIFTSKEGDEGPTQEEDEWQTHGGRKPNDGAPDEVPGDKGNREPDQGEAPQGAGEEGQESRGAGHGNAPSECGVLEDQRLGQSASEDAGMSVHGGWWPSKDKAAGSHERGAALPPSDEDLAGLSADLIKRTFGAGRLPKVDGPTPGHQGPDRLEQAK